MAVIQYESDVSVRGRVLINGGLPYQFLKADGSLDSNTYALASSVHNPVTLGTANGLSLSTQQLSLGLASSGITGALSGTDWNNFNNKFNTPTGLTTNYLPKWNGSGFGNSSIFDDGGNIGIGTNNLAYSKFTIKQTEIDKSALLLETIQGGKAIEVGGYGAVLINKVGISGGRFQILENGRVLINKTDDDLTNQLQVNGSGKFGRNKISDDAGGSVFYGGDLGTGSFIADFRKADGNAALRIKGDGVVEIYSDVIALGTISASPATATNHVVIKSQLDNKADGNHSHGLLKYALHAPNYIDDVTTNNFRTKLFGTSAQGYNISTARWDNPPPLLSSKIGAYSTMLAWSGSDTHAFVAVDFYAPAVVVGGGYEDNIQWTKNLAFNDGSNVSGTWGINISGNASSATNWGGRTANLDVIDNNVGHLLQRGNDGVTRLAEASGVRTWLGLGSNAYTSTPYLPLIGGTLTGNLVVASTATSSLNLGSVSSSWGGDISYPTIFGSTPDRWVMHINPHISYTAPGVNGFSGTMTGSTIRFAGNPATTTYWDIGVGTNGIGEDKFSIGRLGTNFLNIKSNGSAQFFQWIDVIGGIYAYGGLSVGTSGARIGLLAGINAIAIGDSDTGFRQNGDGVLETYANGALVRTDTSQSSTFNVPITATAFFQTSDIRLKTVIPHEHSTTESIKPITFKWKDSKKEQPPQLGYSAGDVQAVMPNAVAVDDDGMMSVNYIQVLVAKVAELELKLKKHGLE